MDMAPLVSGSDILPTILPSLHLLAYSSFIGSTLYQSFIVTKVAHQSLPRSAFTSLQKRLFPVYFSSQSVLLVLTAATYPGALKEIGKGIWIALAVAGVTSTLNLLVYGPRTKKVMIERIHQETRDGRQVENGKISEEMEKLNRSFGRNHAMSIHLNLMTLGAALYYGWTLASRMSFA